MVEWEKECAMKRAFFSSFSVLPIMLATAFTASSAFTLTGTVSDESKSPVPGALVKLLVFRDNGFKRFENLRHRLEKLRLMRVFCSDCVKRLFGISHLSSSFPAVRHAGFRPQCCGNYFFTLINIPQAEKKCNVKHGAE